MPIEPKGKPRLRCRSRGCLAVHRALSVANCNAANAGAERRINDFLHDVALRRNDRCRRNNADSETAAPVTMAMMAVGRRPEDELDDETAERIEDHADDPETTLAKKEKGSLLRQCLTKLSADHREIIDLVYYHEKSVEEVAEIVGIPEATVKTRMFYARKKLSELLKEQGLDRGWP